MVRWVFPILSAIILFKTSRFPKAVGGFLERRIRGKNEGAGLRISPGDLRKWRMVVFFSFLQSIH